MSWSYVFLFLAVISAFCTGVVFFFAGLLEESPSKKIKLLIWGFAFSALGWLGKYFLGGY